MSFEIIKIAKDRNIPLSPLLTALVIKNIAPSDPLAIVSLACKIHDFPSLSSHFNSQKEQHILEQLNYNISIPDTAQIMVAICDTINMEIESIVGYLKKLLLLHLDDRINMFNYIRQDHDVYLICLSLLKDEDLILYEIIQAEDRCEEVISMRKTLMEKDDF